MICVETETAEIHAQELGTHRTLREKRFGIGKHKASCPLASNLVDCETKTTFTPPCNSRMGSCEGCPAMLAGSVGDAGQDERHLVSISALREHEQRVVNSIRGDQKTLRRLLDLGLTPGTCVRVMRVAPLHGPIEVAVRGSRLAIGRDIAASIMVVDATPGGTP